MIDQDGKDPDKSVDPAPVMRDAAEAADAALARPVPISADFAVVTAPKYQAAAVPPDALPADPPTDDSVEVNKARAATPEPGSMRDYPTAAREGRQSAAAESTEPSAAGTAFAADSDEWAVAGSPAHRGRPKVEACQANFAPQSVAAFRAATECVVPVRNRLAPVGSCGVSSAKRDGQQPPSGLAAVFRVGVATVVFRAKPWLREARTRRIQHGAAERLAKLEQPSVALVASPDFAARSSPQELMAGCVAPVPRLEVA